MEYDMSLIINDDSNKKQQQPKAKETSQQANQNYSQQHESVENSRRGLMASRVYRRNSAGEVLQTLTSKMLEVINEKQPATGASRFAIHPIDGKQYGFHYSLIAISLTADLKNHGTQTAFFTYILENSNSLPSPLPVKAMPNAPEIFLTRTPMDAWDDQVYRTVADVVSRATGAQNPLTATAASVGSEIEFTDTDDVRNLIWNAEEAMIATLTASFPGSYAAFSIREFIDPRHHRITSKFSYLPKTELNVLNKPIRSNLSMCLYAQDHNQNNRHELSSYMHQSGGEIMSVDGYVEPVFVDPTPTMNQYGQPVKPPQRFVARVNITQILPGDNTPLTLESFFLALGAYLVVGQNFQWGGVFLPQNADDQHDLGALGYRVPEYLGGTAAKIDTRSSDFGPAETFQLLQDLFFPNPVFSIDCEQAGAYTWLTDALEECSRGSQSARQYVINALDNLTDGAFSRRFTGGEIVVAENNQIQLGSYVDNGKTKDLREIDTLVIHDQFGQNNDIGTIDKWDQTHNNTNVPQAVRSADREAIMRAVVHGNVKFYGTAERYIFPTEFLNALAASMEDAGFRMNPEGLQGQMINHGQVGNTFVANHLANVNVHGMINQGPQMASGPIRSSYNRFG